MSLESERWNPTLYDRVLGTWIGGSKMLMSSPAVIDGESGYAGTLANGGGPSRFGWLMSSGQVSPGSTRLFWFAARVAAIAAPGLAANTPVKRSMRSRVNATE